MNSVLKKTVVSLEAALRYNPDNLELMTSLAEGYVRLGRLDTQTLELCEKVLAQTSSNSLLQQAQTAAYVVEQTHQIEAGLTEGKEPPDAGAIQSSIEILDEFKQIVGDSTTVWFAWTRLCALIGRIDKVSEGIERLKALEFNNLGGLIKTLDWIASRREIEDENWRELYEAYRKIGQEHRGLQMLEQAFDGGVAPKQIGALLLVQYTARYSPSNPEMVPEATRARLFQVMLDYGDPDKTGDWLRKASLFGWEITNYSKDYVRDLAEAGDLSQAFEILQRMPMDVEVKDLLNEIATAFENREDYDDAVRVLQFINDHVLTDTAVQKHREAQLARETDISLAELNYKNERWCDALIKYIAALCRSDEPDDAIIERIDEILDKCEGFEAGALFRLAAYFRTRNDQARAARYLQCILRQDPEHGEALQALEELFEANLKANPDDAPIRLELGKVYIRMQRVKEAIVEFEAAAASPQVADEANRLLAEALRHDRHFEEALAQYQKISITENDLEGLYDLHLEFIRAKDELSALIALQMIARIRADYRDVADRIRELDKKGTSPSVIADPIPDAKMRELIGDLAVGRYEYVEKIGSGAVGVVHKVIDKRLNMVVAMKILRDGLAGSTRALDRFFREARTAASIQHRNIVQIHDYNISSINGQSYICMEYVDGPSLRGFIDERFARKIHADQDYLTEMLYYAIQFFDALEFTSRRGIIHRDIKPDNIMVNSIGEVKVADFGIVHVEEATFTQSGALLGTPRYMSPEQVTGSKLDGRSDIYSAGIVLYEVLTGAPPFLAGDIAYQQVNVTPPSPRKLDAMIPEPVSDFIMKCLEKKPDNRSSTAKEAKAVLVKILDGLGGCDKYATMTAVVSEDADPSELARRNPALSRSRPLLNRPVADEAGSEVPIASDAQARRDRSARDRDLTLDPDFDLD